MLRKYFALLAPHLETSNGGGAGVSAGQGEAEAGAATAAASADEESKDVEISSHLSDRMSPKQAEALRLMKGGKAKKTPVPTPTPATTATPSATTVKAEEPNPAAGSEADGENIIDLSLATADGAAGEGEGSNGSEDDKEPDVSGLDEANKKRVLEAHKDKIKIRKRAQAAEKERDELKERLTATEQRLAERENSPQAASGNMFANFQDARHVQAWVDDAQARIRLILDKTADSKVHRLPNGEEIDLAEDEVGELTNAQALLAHAADWQQTRVKHADSMTRAKALAKSFEKVPEFVKHQKDMAGRNPHAEWPELTSLAAVGKLVQSGAYTLVKKSSVKAVAANSAASHVSGAQSRTGNPEANPPTEIAGSVPSASRSGAGGSANIPSELQERAMKGDQDALREVIRLKTLAKKPGAAAA